MNPRTTNTRTAILPAVLAVALAVASAGALALIFALALGRPAEAAFPGANGDIAFERFGDVHLATPGGSAARKIEIAGTQANPALAPGGGLIAYEHGRGIWVMAADGTGQRRVSAGTSSTTFSDADPAFSPDGRKVVFSRYRSGDSDLWAVGLDGAGEARLTDTPDHDEQDPAWSPNGGEIAYTRVGCEPPRGGMSCVFKMDADGTGQTNLTPEDNFHEGASSEPSWSPDGARIAFRGAVEAEHSSGTDIWTMAADGGDKANVTDDNGTGDHHPAFSPDGEKIAFSSSRPNGDPTAVYVVGSGGGAVERLTASTGYDHDPDWVRLPPAPVPEGGVVFASDRGGDFEIHGMDPDGSRRFPLTSNAAYDGEPAFSPDGRKVAFVSDRGGNEDLYLMNPDGTGQARLTDNAAADRQPVFSPDGNRIAFVSQRHGNREIYVMNAAPEDAATNVPRRLTTDPADDVHPAWSPDNRSIAFVSNRDGFFEGGDLWAMNPDGSGQTKLLNSPGHNEGHPDYAPNGQKIVFDSTMGSSLCDNGAEFCETTDLFALGASSGTPDRLTSDTTTYDERPAYSPDGARIAFRTNRDGNQEIYDVAADGTGVTRLTDDPATDTDPDWRPRTADATRPTIGGVSPKHRSTIRDTTPTIRAVVKDDVTDLQKADVRLYVDGKRISPTGYGYNAATDVLRYDSPRLAKGKRTVKVSVSDAAGNVGARSWYFKIA